MLVSVKNLFNSCGLTYVQPDEGVLLEFTPEDLERALVAATEAPQMRSFNMNDVMLDAVFRIMKSVPDFAGYTFPEHGVFLFRPEQGFEEEDKRAKYQIFQVQLLQLFRGPHFKYAYLVLDDLKAGTDMRKESVRKKSFRLRGISVSTPIAAPEHPWFNEPSSWIYWSDEPQDFNFRVI